MTSPDLLDILHRYKDDKYLLASILASKTAEDTRRAEEERSRSEYYRYEIKRIEYETKRIEYEMDRRKLNLNSYIEPILNSNQLSNISSSRLLPVPNVTSKHSSGPLSPLNSMTSCPSFSNSLPPLTTSSSLPTPSPFSTTHTPNHSFIPFERRISPKRSRTHSSTNSSNVDHDKIMYALRNKIHSRSRFHHESDSESSMSPTTPSTETITPITDVSFRS